MVKQNANVGVAAGINSLGKEAELEGKKARAFPLRFVDGAVFLGPLKVGADPAAVLSSPVVPSHCMGIASRPPILQVHRVPSR